MSHEPDEVLTGAEVRARHAGGRPSAFDPANAATILTYLAAGNYLDTAAAAAGVSRSTLRSWLRAGARWRTPELVRFAADVERAQAESETRALARIEAVADAGVWQASAWLLERRHPEKFGRRTQIDVDVDVLLRENVARVARKFGLDEERLLLETKRVYKELGD